MDSFRLPTKQLVPGVHLMTAKPLVRPKALDLFCGAGGASMGLYRAGFDVTGVDIKPQPRYPFKFIQADALEFPLDGYDFIWASPPCQAYSIMRNLPWLRHKEYPRLIRPIRDRLDAFGVPYTIENVMGAKHDGMVAHWLCGTMFGLPFYRHRLLETNWFWMRPPHEAHPVKEQTVRNGRMCGSRARDIVFQRRGKELTHRIIGNGAQRPGAGVGHAAGIALVREAMQIDWMSREEITQAIPPAYSEFIGKQALQFLRSTSGAAT